MELVREMEQLIKDGAFTLPDTEDVVVSPVFMIPKRSGGMRLIHDLRAINAHLEAPHFSIHGCKDAASVVRSSQWLCALDLRRGYQQVLMDRSARRFLGACVGGKTVVSAVLPFGLSLSPYIFTRLTNWIAGMVRKRTGLSVAVYIDDFLVGAPTKEEIEKGLGEIRRLFDELGVVLSTKKPITIAREVEFLGFRWSAEKKTIGLTEERRKEYRRVIKNLLRSPHPVKRWRTAIGKLVFLKEAVGPTLRHVRSIIRLVKGRRDTTRIRATGEAEEDLIWWSEVLARTSEMSLLCREVSASIASDASDAAVAYSLELDGVRLQKSIPVQEGAKHINARELEALLECLKEHGDLLKGRRVIWYCDNVSARAAVTRQGSQQCGEIMWQTTKEVIDLLNQKDIKIVAKYVPGSLNRAADALSRPLQEEKEWAEVLRMVTDRWGPLQLDPCGATRPSTGPLEDTSWSQSRTLLKPDTKRIMETVELLELVVDKEARRTPASFWESCAVIVTPTWQKATWWNTLTNLRVDWIELGRLQDRSLMAWASRNGHNPSWTASLVPTRMRCGLRGRNNATDV